MIVTAALLEKGDVFEKFGVEYAVVFIDETHVHYISTKSSNTTKDFSKCSRQKSHTNTIGIKSKEKINLIRPIRPKEKPKLERAKGEYSNTTPFGIKI